ncbi:phosphotransferase [Gramella jeungdoensis]|uniref:Phosphotransferase n=1 Tax=Gramella jeungdoensis TaxID=708091 RepID=A0ABT0YZ65_9FLAO|nr:phosphotransferase [Gramella jeungdoensis]MCM8568757.1 phosphotransferase [Gramella jeungdoensis]
MFRKIGLFRLLLAKDNIEAYIPDKRIRSVIGKNVLIAFNRGTIGPERKVTGLCMEKKRKFFIKYADSKIAIDNVRNEHFVLKQLNDFHFVPKVIAYDEGDDFALLQTTVLSGEKINTSRLTKEILNRLIEINNLKVITSDKTNNNNEYYCFAHGDFCPWNLMINEGEILIYDWELAGNYPVGYDFFTYLFQTNFLLNPKKDIGSILSEGRENLEYYFDKIKVANWKDQLIEFAEIKIDKESKKANSLLKKHFENLLDYAKEA